MHSSQDNQDSSLLLACFYKSLISENNPDDTSLNLKIISNLLNAGFNINQKFPDHFLARSEPDLFDIIPPGGTALHFVYCRKFSIDIFNALIEHGADFTLKNANNQTILHQMIRDWRYKKESKTELFINSVLSAHIKFHNISNPVDNNGLSHFHCACIVNHTEAVEFFLVNGASIDQATNINSGFLGGYTALHLAAAFSNIEIIKILMNHKANAFIENKRGLAPLHLLIYNRLESFDNLRDYGEYDQFYDDLENNEKMISIFLEKNYSLTTSFYAASTLKNVSWINRFLEHIPDINHPISMDSLNWPGYTALHFAAHCNIDTVKLLLEKGGNIVVEDTDGVTPLNICLKVYAFEEVCSMLLNDSSWNNTLLSDGKTKLVDVISSLKNASTLRSFLNENLENANSIVPINSPFWPGYTLLHMAIVISEMDWGNSNLKNTEIIKVCLNYGSDVSVKNVRGETPIHLAFRLQKHLSILLEHLLESPHNIMDILDENDLSYLHIACMHNSERLVERLLPTSDVNLAYKGRPLQQQNINTGWTALHFAIGNCEGIIKLLLDHGADIEAKDACGMTPIHWIFGHKWHGDILFTHANLKESTTKFGLTYLHAAAFADNKTAVERLISLGSNLDAVIDCHEPFLMQADESYFLNFSGLTPMETALRNQSFKAFNGFLNGGVKMSSDHFKYTKILRQFHIFNAFTLAFWRDGELRDNIEKEIGLTMLHINCYRADIMNMKQLLDEFDEGWNVNARVHTESKAFPGCTPLHMLIKNANRYEGKKQRTIVEKIEMLLERGADVTLADAEGNTPVHLSLELVERRDWSLEEAEKCTTLLMYGQHDFSINPVNTDGISHFHVACLVHNVEAVQGFLQHGVDVNQTIDLYCEKYANCTALHLAFEFPLTKFLRNQSPSVVINLLLKYGADVRAQDARGNTALHYACRDARANVEILSSLMSLGADVKKENVYGETPFEILLSSPDALDEQIKLFIKHGSQFNDSNCLSEKGYIGIFILANAKHLSKTIPSRVRQYSSEDTRGQMDRTVIHNAVAISKASDRMKAMYCEIIKEFLKKGTDVDHQDKSGKTALHYAAQFGNSDAVNALLELGADINIVDSSGKSPFSYAFERCLKMKDTVAAEILFMQTYVRKLVGLEVSQLNEDIADEMGNEGIVNEFIYCYEQNNELAIQASKSMSVGSTLITLHDFLSDTRTIANYMFMPKKVRDQIDDYFKSFNDMVFRQAWGISVIFKSQYSKAVARIELIKEAAYCLRIHLGVFFPGLCEDILIYLTNAELRNVIKSV